VSVPELRKYVWDEQKADTNFGKHGVQFEDAQETVEDPFAIIVFDDDHSTHEDRYIVIGLAWRLRTLTVGYTEINAHTSRIISARRANKSEQRIYEGNLGNQS